MTDALRDRLQADLGTGFVIERELGGGGMSRVFVAEEHPDIVPAPAAAAVTDFGVARALALDPAIMARRTGR